MIICRRSGGLRLAESERRRLPLPRRSISPITRSQSDPHPLRADCPDYRATHSRRCGSGSLVLSPPLGGAGACTTKFSFCSNSSRRSTPASRVSHILSRRRRSLPTGCERALRASPQRQLHRLRNGRIRVAHLAIVSPRLGSSRSTKFACWFRNSSS